MSFQIESEHHWLFLCLLGHHGRRRIRQLWLQRPPSLRSNGQSITSEAGVSWFQQQLSCPPLGWQSLRDAVLGPGLQVLFIDQLPRRLRAIPDPPLALYVQGSSELLARTSVAVVGARRCSATGATFAEQLAERLAAAGLVVISGLALGIDAAAHSGAADSGATVAVLGSGLRNLYPKSHAGLAQRIINNGGAVVSEYLPTHPSYPGNFPERNRLISGLAKAVVVVEAGLRSGSLITARLALEQGRDVLAVPGSVVSPVSAGCHRLLQQGAGLVTNVQDVFAALDLDLSASPRGPGPRAQLAQSPEGQVYAHLGGQPLSVEALGRATGLTAPQLLPLLTRLELAGFVQRLPQGYIPTPS